jgi:MFS family permease
VTLYGSIGLRFSRRFLWFLGFGLAPICWWVLLGEPSLPLIMAAMVAEGIVIGPINPLMVTIRHERAPAEIRGRVFASYSAIGLAAQPLGMITAGGLIEGVGFNPMVLAFAIGQQLLALGMFFVPAFHELEDSNPERVGKGGRVAGSPRAHGSG